MSKLTGKWLFIFSLAALTACKHSNTNTLDVTGEIRNIDSVMAQFPGTFPSDSILVYLYEVPFSSDGSPVKLDSTFVTAKNNSFKLHAQVNTVGLYDVMLANGPMIPFVNDASDIKLNVNLLEKENYYTISGSKASDELREFIFGYSEKSNNANAAFKKLDSLKMHGSADSVIIEATDQKNISLEGINDYVEQFISKVNNPIVAAFVLGTGSNTLSQEKYEDVLNKMTDRYPSDPSLNYLKNQLTEQKNQIAKTQQGTWVGKAAPELTMPDVNGKEVSLSSFRGKYVLVDFWASWCGPCRAENPNVVKAYNAFKNKNFTVLGVSLDKEKDNWLEAIKKDNLTWTHISDLAFWNSKAVELYKFQGIPYNVLIDPQGIVIGESLRGDDLMNKLKEVIK